MKAELYKQIIKKQDELIIAYQELDNVPKISYWKSLKVINKLTQEIRSLKSKLDKYIEVNNPMDYLKLYRENLIKNQPPIDLDFPQKALFPGWWEDETVAKMMEEYTEKNIKKTLIKLSEKGVLFHKENPKFRPGEGYGPPRFIEYDIDELLEILKIKT